MTRTVTLKIKSREKFQHFLAFVKDLDYVEIQEKGQGKKKKKIATDDDFFAIAGLWQKRNAKNKIVLCDTNILMNSLRNNPEIVEELSVIGSSK